MTIVAGSGNPLTINPATAPTSTFAEVPVEEIVRRRGLKRRDLKTVFNNRNRELNVDVANELKTVTFAEAFHVIIAQMYSGYVFYEDDKYFEIITSASLPKAGYSADTVEELILGVNKIYEK